MSEHTDTNLSLDDVHRLALTALTRHRCSVDQATAVADTVTAAERDRCASHGLFRIPGKSWHLEAFGWMQEEASLPSLFHSVHLHLSLLPVRAGWQGSVWSTASTSPRCGPKWN